MKENKKRGRPRKRPLEDDGRYEITMRFTKGQKDKIIEIANQQEFVPPAVLVRSVVLKWLKDQGYVEQIEGGDDSM